MDTRTNKEKEDDRFFRRIIWWMGGLALASAGSIIAIEVQILNLSESTKEIRKTNKEMRKQNKSLNKINIVLQQLLDSSKYSNSMMLSQIKKTESIEERQIYIFGEQKKRGYKFKVFDKHMDNPRVHK
jgi:hypothetical protein